MRKTDDLGPEYTRWMAIIPASLVPARSGMDEYEIAYFKTEAEAKAWVEDAIEEDAIPSGFVCRIHWQV